MKKRILSFLLMIAFLLPCAALLSACKNDDSSKYVAKATIGTTTKYYEKLTDAIVDSDQSKVIKITLIKDVVLDKTFHIVKNQYEINLNGRNISFPDDTDGNGIFQVEYSAKLTINGNGIVNSASLKNDYSMAVWANFGGTVIINGGTYTNVGAKDTEDDGITFNNNDLIYASRKDGQRKSKIEINGGTFIGNYENSHASLGGLKYTLNVKDSDPGEIVVKGGEFREYNPHNGYAEMPPIDYAKGYIVEEQVKNGVTWYVVTGKESDN